MWCFVVDGSDPEVWGMLRTGRRIMLELVEGICNVARHGDVDCAFGVIPFESHAEVAFARPFCGDGVKGFEGGNKVVSMFFTHILDSKIINNKAESDRSSCVAIETMGEFARMVAEFCKVFNKMVIGEDSGLWEAIHAFDNLCQDVTIVDEGC